MLLGNTEYSFFLYFVQSNCNIMFRQSKCTCRSYLEKSPQKHIMQNLLALLEIV